LKAVDKLLVTKENESVLDIKCDPSIAEELKDFFSFFVPGHKFMPAFRRRIWDGKIKLFNAITGELPVGLYPYLRSFCEKRNYSMEHVSSSYGSPDEENPINLKLLMEFIESLNLPHKIRDYQFDAFVEGIKRMRAILVSPTGSGKSLIIYCLMRWYIDNYSDKVLIIVPTTSLVEQMNSDFKSYGYNDSHLVYSGKDKNTDKRVMISTWQSIHRLNIDWFDQFGLVFGDECHGFKAKSLTSIMHKARQAKYRFGTTGTLDGSQTHELVLQGLFGKIFKVTTTRKLQDSDTLAQLNISMVMLNHSNEIKKDFSKKTYHEEIDYLINNTNRNSFISKLASDQKGNTLVLFQFVEKHGKVLYDLINNRIDEKRKLFFVSGEVDTTDREAIRGIVEKQDNAIIVASLGTFSTGINIRNLHNIIFASPSKSQIRVLQSIGRGLRKSDNNVNTRLFDIADDIRSKDKTNYSYIHALERIKIYKKEKFNFKIHKVDLT
jgi:superfamily II DNA or RNA helicase